MHLRWHDCGLADATEPILLFTPLLVRIMRRMSGHHRGLVAALVAMSGCGDNIQLAPDAYVSPPCWRDTHTPSGTVTLGTGISEFVPMPDSVELEYATQAAGYDLPVNARISGLIPGDPHDVLAPSNPRTRFKIYFVDQNSTPCDPMGACVASGICFNGSCLTPTTQGRCGSSIGYVPAAAGNGYELGHALAVEFDNSLSQADLQGKRLLVTVEVLDASDHYATDQKVITLIAPAM